MPEKKYMTASEFLIKHNVIEKKGKYFGITDGLVGDHTNKINKLDSKFIDREELKDKINKIFDNHSCYFSDKFDEFEFNNIKREILELLEE